MYKGYASYFTAYLINSLKKKEVENIKNIILFGSASKDEAIEESDIDLFIETKKKDKKIEEKIYGLLSDFYKSREGLIFKAKGVKNSFHILIGSLENWNQLKKSIESTGIVLYGPFISSNIQGKKYAIITWDKIDKNRGAFLNKIYGFSIQNKKYPGLLEKNQGRKLGKSGVMIPIENKEEILRLIKKHSVRAKILEIYS